MAWVATATLGVGLLSYTSGKKASEAANSRQDSANAMSGEQLDFNKDVYADNLEFNLLDRERFDTRYEKLESIFGPIESNLGEFYNSLTPETFAAAGLTEQAQQFQVAKQNFTTQLAQRGLGASGAAVAGLKDMELQSAKDKAAIRRDAPFKVAEAQQSFLNSRGSAGSPPGSADTSGVNNAMTNSASNFQQQANNASASASSLYQSAGNLLMTGAQYAGQNSGANSGTTSTSAAFNIEQRNNFQGDMIPEAIG